MKSKTNIITALIIAAAIIGSAVAICRSIYNLQLTIEGKPMPTPPSTISVKPDGAFRIEGGPLYIESSRPGGINATPLEVKVETSPTQSK